MSGGFDDITAPEWRDVSSMRRELREKSASASRSDFRVGEAVDMMERCPTAPAVPAAGRDLTEEDVEDALVEHGLNPRCADYLNQIVRPSGGVGQPDTADLWQTIRDYLDENDLGDELLVRLGTSGQFAAEPRSWSLPAPPPDDVTVVHVDDMRFEREGARWLDADGHWHPWARLVTGGTVVEGEPPAEPPRFERGFYRLARDLETEDRFIGADTEVVIYQVHGAVALVGSRSGAAFNAPFAALAAAGAVQVGE